MPKYNEIQTRKLISSYGGIGSILETTRGALKIEPFDRWRYFVEAQQGKIEPVEIEDERLVTRLKHIFPNLKRLLKVPMSVSNMIDSSKPQNESHIADSTYFPEWLYCNKCGRLRHIRHWFEGWRINYKGKENRDSFIPPKCYACYKEAQERGKGKKFYYLEQVRFIMTAPDGTIRDVPWERWPIALKNIKEEDSNKGSIDLQWEKKAHCCDKQDLRYEKSTKFFDLAGVTIKCNNCGKKNTLAGLFGLRILKTNNDVNDNDKRILFKPVIRTSNSVYYPLITHSLYLPQDDFLTSALKTTASTLYETGMSIDQIYNTLKNKHNISLKALKNYLEPADFIPENEYRLREYNFITSNSNTNEHLNYSYQNVSNLNPNSINTLVKIKRLKLTSVQTGFSRQEPIDKDLFAQRGDEFIQINQDKIVKAQFTSTKGNITDFLPAIESFGEGIFITLDRVKLDNWFNKNWKSSHDFRKRIDTLQHNAKTTDIIITQDKEKLINNHQYLSKFILIHTLAHVLIKELEFLVGYPATSLSERLYIDLTEMQGLMIYTIAGSEGSYGGLISNASSERFEKILKSALFRARDCASDPVCYNSEGQGFGGLNLAACYSCALLPETSCEEYNGFLDRVLLIDEEFGFFHI